MKKIMFLLGFFLIAGMTANAQTETAAKKSCSKSCAKKCMKSSTAAVKSDAETKVASVMMTADAVAEADENIEKRVCAVSGTASFYQKSVCPASGKVSWNQVEYNEAEKKFTQVAAASMERDVETQAGGVEVSKEAAPGKAKKACSKSCAKKCMKGEKTKS